jgi:hypothetical protein
MNNYNFTIVGGDTDSIMFCKPDMSMFTKEEQLRLLSEINAILPDQIRYESDGIFTRVIYLKAKNYIMVDEKGKRHIKGSSLKSSKLEPICKQLINECIELLIQDNKEGLKDVYKRYQNMVDNITDISPWCSKKSLSPTTFNSTRKNETDIIDAIKGKEYRSGDKIYLYVTKHTIETGEFYKVGKKKGLPKTKEVSVLKCKEDFDGNYSKEHYLKRLEKTIELFTPVLGGDFFTLDNIQE